MGYLIAPPDRATGSTPPHCSPGALVLANAIASRFPSLLVLEGAYGCFNRRKIKGSDEWSLHADGSALDVGIGWHPTEQQRVEVAQLIWKLTAGCYSLGVQRQIFNHHQWDAERGWRPLSHRADQHEDHVHVELCRQAAWGHPLRREVADCALA